MRKSSEKKKRVPRTYGTGSLFLLKSAKWLMQYRPPWALKPISKTIEAPDRKQAEKQLADWVKELDRQNASAHEFSMNYIFERYLADHRKHDRVETPIVEKKIEKYLRPRIGHLDAKSFGQDELDFYISSRKQDKPPAANGTINREISIISHGLRLAAEKLQRIVFFGKNHLREAKPRQGYVTEELYQKLLLDLPDYVKPIWCFAYYTGVRSGQLKKLRWEWYDWDERVIRCPGEYRGERITKNAEIHIIPVFPQMEEFLKLMWDQRNPDCPYLFQRHGKRIRSFRDAFKASCERVGATDILFHDQRRTAVTNMIREKVPEKDVMAVSGHLDRSMLDRYTITKEQDVKRVRDHMAERYAAKRAAAAASLNKSLNAETAGASIEAPSVPAKYKQ